MHSVYNITAVHSSSVEISSLTLVSCFQLFGTLPSILTGGCQTVSHAPMTGIVIL